MNLDETFKELLRQAKAEREQLGKDGNVYALRTRFKQAGERKLTQMRGEWKEFENYMRALDDALGV